MKVKRNEKFIITVDMGGTKVLAAALNSSKGIITRVKVPTDPNATGDSYVKTLVKIIKETVKETGLNDSQVKAVCLGIPGSLNPFTGEIGLAPNLGLKNINIKVKLEKLIHYPVLIENDVNLGALGIKYFGAGKKSQNMLAVFIGTGIGGGLILNGNIYRGSGFAAGEIGHIKVKENGPLCGCGNRGCFEAVASRTAIVNKIISEIKQGKKSKLTKLVKEEKRIKSGSLAEAVKSGDKVVIKYLTSECKTIGKVLADLTNFMNFDLIVLGGGLIEALHSFMLPLIKDEMDKHLLKDASKFIKVKASMLGDDAALYGGIPLAEEFLGIKI
jgi:glucokinase